MISAKKLCYQIVEAISALKSRTTTAEGDITSLGTRTGTLEGKVSTLEGRDYIEEQGTSGSWAYIKWHSGRYEAERVYNVGQVTINASTISDNVKTSAEIAIPSLPHTLTAGRIQVVYTGNSSNSYAWMEQRSEKAVRLVKVLTTSVTLQDNTFTLSVVGGKWK